MKEDNYKWEVKATDYYESLKNLTESIRNVAEAMKIIPARVRYEKRLGRIMNAVLCTIEKQIKKDE